MGLKEKLKNKLSQKQTNQVQDSGRTTVVKPEDITEEQRKMLEDFHKFREGYISPAAEAVANYFANIRNISLDDKVDEFISWYSNNMVKGHYTDIGEYRKPRDLKNFIEKMAVWYELRYPDYEVNRMMYCCSQESKDINEIMFYKNQYMNNKIDILIKELNWSQFYNTHAFIKSLPSNEKYYFEKAKYSDYTRLFIDDYRGDIIIYLTSNGFVKEIRETYLTPINEKNLDSSELIGMNIKDVIVILKEKYNCTDKQLKCIIEEINNYDNKIMFKEELLNCVMYRIIERGGNRIGPRRGFLFAKEFGRNIDIPMMYAIDRSDPGLRLFINEYIKAGGSKDLICYIGYFSRTNEMEKLDTTSIQDLILTQNNNAATKYTPEEDELHQILVNVLASQVDQDEVRKEEVKQLRLQRRLNNSKNIKS